MKDNDKVTLTFGQLKQLISEAKATGDAKASNKLEYGNQMEFKAWAKKQGLTKKNGADYYFDSTDAVDGKTAKDIKGVKANGTMTWAAAAKKLKKYFKIKESIVKEAYENDYGEEVLTYGDILDYLDGLSSAELSEIQDDPELDVDRFMDNFEFPVNGEYVEDAMREMAGKLLSGATIATLRKRYGETEL